ncbi:MAG: A/G-specific adenine glycosylase [Hyphomonadaceae bacterium]|nr:A/G-specific adenine glycosylase [Hyphomonadaceae bacterium]
MSNKGVVRAALLDWYDRHARSLPWRRPPGAAARPDPYAVWLSEVMLQQTTVAAAAPYFDAFRARWPTVADLAAAPREAVLQAWAGLGYYSRARNLHAAAQALAAMGRFPDDEAGWRALPGVGAYTAAAVAAIAFDRPANVVDGNVERVMARWFAEEAPLPDAKPTLARRAASLVTADRPGDWAQALMDLGATICTPRKPRCPTCPVAFACAALAGGAPETYPRRRPRTARPVRHGVAFRLEHGGAILLVRRPDEGLLGGMPALPSTPWRTEAWSHDEALAYAPAPAAWRRTGAVKHIFTHFALTLDVWSGQGAAPASGGDWVAVDELSHAGLPTVFRKAAALAA